MNISATGCLDRRTVLRLGVAGLLGTFMVAYPVGAAVSAGIKQVTLVRRKPGMSRKAFANDWIKVHTPLSAAPGLAACSLTLLHQDDGAGFDGITARYFATEKDRMAFVTSPQAAKLRADTANLIALEPAPLDFIADEVVVLPQTPGAWLRGTGHTTTPATKGMALLTRKPNLTRAAFLAHWHTTHARLALACPGIARYTQLAVRPASGIYFDAVAELYFENQAEFARYEASPEKQALLQDGALLMDQDQPMLGEERMLLPTGWQPVWSAT